MNDQRYFELALTRKQQALAKRLAKLDPDAVMDDPEIQALDEKKPMAAMVVVAYVHRLQDRR